MSDGRSRLAGGAFALVSVLCCLALPLLLAAGIGALVVVLVGAAALAVAALAAACIFVLARSHRRRAEAFGKEERRAGTPL